MDEQMPPLPEPDSHKDSHECDVFSAGQMHAYANEYAAALSQPAAQGLFVAEVVVSDDDLDMGFSEEFIRGDVRLPNGTYQLYTKATP